MNGAPRLSGASAITRLIGSLFVRVADTFRASAISYEQVRKLQNHINRAARLLQTISDEDLVTVARATVKLHGRFVKQGMAALSNPLNARHNAICEIALLAYPHAFVPDVSKGEEVPEGNAETGGVA
jgi:hypothetical protein